MEDHAPFQSKERQGRGDGAPPPLLLPLLLLLPCIGCWRRPRPGRGSLPSFSPRSSLPPAAPVRSARARPPARPLARITGLVLFPLALSSARFGSRLEAYRSERSEVRPGLRRRVDVLLRSSLFDGSLPPCAASPGRLRWPAERECDLWIKLAVSHAVVNGVMRSPLGCSDATELRV